MFPMTFDEWRATGRDVADLSTDPALADIYECQPNTPGRVYAGDLVIERMDEFSWMLLIANSCHASKSLLELERELYDFSKAEHEAYARVENESAPNG